MSVELCIYSKNVIEIRTRRKWRKKWPCNGASGGMLGWGDKMECLCWDGSRKIISIIWWINAHLIFQLSDKRNKCEWLCQSVNINIYSRACTIAKIAPSPPLDPSAFLPANSIDVAFCIMHSFAGDVVHITISNKIIDRRFVFSRYFHMDKSVRHISPRIASH